MQGVRILEIPKCRMVSSGIGMFGQEQFTAYEILRYNQMDYYTPVKAKGKTASEK